MKDKTLLEQHHERVGQVSEGTREAMAKWEASRKQSAAIRKSIGAETVGNRPRCITCGKELALFKFRKPGSNKLYGGYGDNKFCGLRCGYAYGLNASQRK